MKRLVRLITSLGFILIGANINLSAQSLSPKASFGLSYTNFKAPMSVWETGRVWRRGFWGTIETNPRITKWLSIDLGLTYQERMPLEVLPFPLAGVPAGVSGQFVLMKFPTNPQNELFDTGNYLRIPNFKYLTLEAIPSVTFGKKLSVSLGVGLFGSILLNRTQMTITREDLPAAAPFFGPPRNIGDAPVLYHRYDAGWIPRGEVQYRLSEKLSLGVVVKSYQSFVRLNDTFVDPYNLSFNMRWEAYAYGLSVQYHLGRD